MTDYRGSIERTGGALALGGASVGTGLALVAWGSGDAGVFGVAGYWLLGMVLGLVVIGGIGWPVWRLVRARGWRGPVAAGVTGAGVAGMVTLGVVTAGFGAGLADGAALATIWASAAATAAVAAFLGGLIALAMWLVAYRPV